MMAYYMISLKPTRGRRRLQMLHDLTKGDGYATVKCPLKKGRDGDTVK